MRFIGCIALLVLVSCGGTDNAIDPAQLKASVQIANEHANPTNYLEVASKWRENMIGRKVFEGSVLNKAKGTTFDELLLTFHFFDSLNVKVGERSFYAKETLTPGKVYKFKIKTFAPVPTKTYTCTVKARIER